MTAILDGTTILDISRGTAGCYAALLLAEQGANCIRVDDKAGPAPLPAERAALFNRSKRSIALDLEKEGSGRVVNDLADHSDILITDMGIERRERLGLSYDALGKANRRLIYCSISSFGEKGRLGRTAASDGLVCAFAGTFGAQGGMGQPPVYVFLPFAAYGAAMLIAYGASLALLNREMRGCGQKVETSILGAALTMESGGFISAPTIQPVTVTRSIQQGVAPAYRLYECQDDWFIIACGNPTFWNKLCMALDRIDLLSDPRFEGMPWALADVTNRIILTEIFAGIFKQKPRAHWLKLFEENDVPCAPVNRRSEFMDDPQVAHNHMIIEVEDRYLGRMRQMGIPLAIAGYPAQVKWPAPAPGEHTEAVLKDLGYSAGRVRGLKQEGVI